MSRKTIEAFRASVLKAYVTCPMMCRFRYVDGYIPEQRSSGLIRGSALHAAVHTIHRESLFKDSVDVLRQKWDEAVAEEPEVPISDEDKLEGQKADAEEIIQGYASKKYNRDADVVLSEARFTVDIGKHKFTGTIDQIRRKNGALQLLDFKSDLAVPEDSYLANDYQFSIYSYAMRHGEFIFDDDTKLILKEFPSDLFWYHLRHHLPYKKSGKWGKAGDERGDPFIPVNRTEADLARIEHEISQIVRGIKMGCFFKSPAKMLCRFLLLHRRLLRDCGAQEA